MFTPDQASATDRLPQSQQAVIVLQQFRSVKTQADYVAAAKRWGALRPQLQQYEAGACKDAGASSELDIMVGTLSDLASAPINVILALAQVAIGFAEVDRTALFAALEDAYREALLHVGEKQVDKLAEPVKKMAAKSRDQALLALREALLKYLQSVSRRSRKHFNKLISSVFGTISSIGGTAAIAGKILLQPSKIAPEWCGLLGDVDLAERDAFTRVFPTLMADRLAPGLPVIPPH